jgi:archaellum component FlaF (FlaF/FlaG flagellin family)
MSRTYLFISTLIFASILFSCTSDEIGNSKDVNPDAVYFDYEVWADETNSDVTVNLQYRMGGKNGTTLVLDEPSKVLFDGEQLKVDSAKVTGAYYEIQKPTASFGGKHTVTFTDLNKKEYKEEIEFVPFTIDSLPAVMNRGDLVFTFKGLEPVDVLDVSLTDTSFTSTDISDTDTIRNGKLVIPAKKLSALVNGPITLLFYKETIKPVKNGTKEGGRILIRYSLKREFELKDASNL